MLTVKGCIEAVKVQGAQTFKLYSWKTLHRDVTELLEVTGSFRDCDKFSSQAASFQ